MMTKNIIISRHPSTIEWLKNKLPYVDLVTPEIDFTVINQGDCVYGNLPAPIIAELNTLGARYFHIQIVVPLHLRGTELTHKQLDEIGTQWIEVEAKIIK